MSVHKMTPSRAMSFVLLLNILKFEIPRFIPKYPIGRNDPCQCGKRKVNGDSLKYKNCCGQFMKGAGANYCKSSWKPG